MSVVIGRVYIVQHIESGKRYAGFTTNSIQERWKQHLKAARCGRSECRRFTNALRKYGPDAFSLTQVFEGSHEDALAFEAELIASENLRDRKIGYNLQSGGSGQHHSEESKARMSAAHSGKTLSPEHRANIGKSVKGRDVSEETRAKLSSKLKGRIISAEQRAKQSAKMKGRKRPPMSDATRAKLRAAQRSRSPEAEAARRDKISATQRGKTIPLEVRAKISATLTGRKNGPSSPQKKARQSAALRGRKLSPEHVAKLRGRKFSPETIERMRAAAQLRERRKRESRK